MSHATSGVHASEEDGYAKPRRISAGDHVIRISAVASRSASPWWPPTCPIATLTSSLPHMARIGPSSLELLEIKDIVLCLGLHIPDPARICKGTGEESRQTGEPLQFPSQLQLHAVSSIRLVRPPRLFWPSDRPPAGSRATPAPEHRRAAEPGHRGRGEPGSRAGRFAADVARSPVSGPQARTWSDRFPPRGTTPRSSESQPLKVDVVGTCRP
jgi:hypothetical protein